LLIVNAKPNLSDCV